MANMGKYFDKLATKNPWGFYLFGVCRPMFNLFFQTHGYVTITGKALPFFLPILGTRGLEQ